MFEYTGTSRTLHMHAVKIMLGLFLVFTVLPSFAQHPRITQLIAEKQAKMEKLEKCQGTTKNLKIAGISTLGITAVGIGANIAEAVVLSNTKDDIEKAKAARDEQQTIKDERLAKQRQQECEQDGTKYWTLDGYCNCKPGYIDNGLGGCLKPQTASVDNANTAVTNAVAEKTDGPVVISMNGVKVDNKAIALSRARMHDEKISLADQECSDSFPATLTCKVGDKEYVFYFDVKELPEHAFMNPQVTKDNVIATIKNSADFRDLDTSKCEIIGNTVTCKKNSFVVQKFSFGYAKAAEAQDERINEFRNVRLDDINQVQRLLSLKSAVSNPYNCKVESAGKGQRQDYVRCEEEDGTVKIFEFDNIIKSNNSAGQVEKSLQQYLCGTNNKDLISEICAGDVNYVMYGTRIVPKTEVKTETKKEEKPAEPQKAAGVQKASDKQACKELEPFAIWADGECKYEGDECTTVYGKGIGVYEKTDDGLKCKITECRLSGYDVDVSDGGYSCTILASKKAQPVKEEPKPIVLKSSAKEECERDGNHLWLNGKDCKGVGEGCSVFIGGGVGTYKKVGSEIKCVLDTCNNSGYVVADDKLSCKSASFNSAVVAPVAVSAKEEPKVEPKKVEPKAEPKKEEPGRDWTVQANAQYDKGYTNDRDSSVYWVGGKMMKFDKNGRPVEVDNIDNIKKAEEEAKLKKEQAEREAKAQKQAEFERQQAEQKREREERQKRLNDLCSKAGCGADCLVDSLGSGKVKVHCSGIEKYYDANSNEIAKP